MRVPFFLVPLAQPLGDLLFLARLFLHAQAGGFVGGQALLHVGALLGGKHAALQRRLFLIEPV